MADPVLIFSHGATLNGASWNPVLRHLDRRFRVITVDLPGHGSRRTEAYTLEGAARTIAEAAKQVAPARVVLLGDSLGGYSSIAAASLVAPQQLAGLVVGGCSVNFVGAPLRALKRRWFFFSKVLIPLFGEERLVRRLLPKAMKKMGHTEADTQAIINAHARMSAFGEAVASLANRDMLPAVAQIAAPVVFVNGTRDKYPMASEALFVKTAPRGEAKHFDSEHGVTLWKAEEFAHFVNDWVGKLR